MNQILLIVFSAMISLSVENDLKTQVLKRCKPKHKNVKIMIEPSGQFKKFIGNSDLWVDKSLLIKEVWESECGILIITAATRWGKTINLDMIKFHAEHVVDDHGNLQDVEKTDAYQYFLQSKIVLKIPTTKYGFYTVKETLDSDPLISKFSDINDEHLARHPVIYLSGTLLDINDVNSIGGMVSRAYKRHAPLRNYLVRNRPHLLDEFDDFYSVHRLRNVPLTDVVESIVTLSETLHGIYGKKVVILMDEHDCYLRDAYLYDKKFIETEQTENFLVSFQKFMSTTFKDNPYLAKGIITGVLSVEEATFLSRFNNVKLINIYLESEFSPYYGIYEPEFHEIMKKADFNEEFQQNASRWYDGYRMENNLNLRMFSIWSISRCVSTRKIDNYWTQSALTTFLPPLFKQRKVQEIISQFLRYRPGHDKQLTISRKTLLKFSRDDLALIQRLYLQEEQYDDNTHHREIIFSWFVAIGILTIDPEVPTSSSDSIALRIPNKELWVYLQSLRIELLNINQIKYDHCKAIVRNYANEDGEKSTLDALGTCIAKMLYKETRGEFGVSNKILTTSPRGFTQRPQLLENEVIMETFVFTMIKHALILLENPAIITQQLEDNNIYRTNKRIIDVLFVLDNGVAILCENKYNKGEKDRTASEKALKQALSYACFLRKYDFSNIRIFKFLAIVVNYDHSVELMSATLTRENLKKCIDAASNEIDKESKDNYVNWTEGMWNAANKIEPSVIISTRSMQQDN